jgi:molybdate transport system substrate-binding protein
VRSTPLGRTLTAVAVVIALTMSACAGGADDDKSDVVVSAAASLTDVFGEIETAFEQQYPEFDVLLNLGGSTALREQILEGAPVDVFASADLETMDELVAAGEAGGMVQVFATNSMVIAVPVDNPGAVQGLGDMQRDDLFVGLCADGVPCGVFARKVLASADVDPSVDTNEPSVRSLLLKIGLGEVDVGIVYTTDAIAAVESVEPIAIAPEHNVVAEYPIALLDDAPNASGGGAFLRFVTSGQGAEILRDHGFGAP